MPEVRATEPFMDKGFVDGCVNVANNMVSVENPEPFGCNRCAHWIKTMVELHLMISHGQQGLHVRFVFCCSTTHQRWASYVEFCRTVPTPKIRSRACCAAERAQMAAFRSPDPMQVQPCHGRSIMTCQCVGTAKLHCTAACHS